MAYFIPIFSLFRLVEILLYNLIQNFYLEMLKNPFSKFPIYIVVGTIPIGVFGILFDDLIEGFFKTFS